MKNQYKRKMAGTDVKSAVVGGMSWTSEKSQSASRNGFFIFVDSSAKNLSKRALSGAPRLWTKDASDTVFLPRYRICGSTKDVTDALRSASIPESDITSALSEAITKTNYDSSRRQEFQAELESFSRIRDEKNKQEKLSFTPAEIAAFAVLIKNGAYVVSSRKPESETKKPKKTPPHKGHDLKTQVELAKTKGKIVDVSSLDGGGRGIPRDPNVTYKSKFGLDGFHLISSSYDSYVKALEEVYGSETLTAQKDELDKLREKFETAKKVVRVKVKPTTPRPSDVQVPSLSPRHASTTTAATATTAVPVSSGAPSPRPTAPVVQIKQIPRITKTK